MWVKWNLISVHLEIVLISTQDRCMICAERTIGLESFWTHLIVLLGDVIKQELISIRLEIVLISTQDRCTVCAECIIVMEITLGTPDSTPR
jgi:hypothetical protein